MELEDPFGRRIESLRLSVTDRCDLRCSHCLTDRAIAYADVVNPGGNSFTFSEL
jgi:molybdenum cofactor biosynthesis enzyme MoaA